MSPQVSSGVVRRVRRSIRPCALSIVVVTRSGYGVGRSLGGSGRRDTSGGGLKSEGSSDVRLQSGLVVFHREHGIAVRSDDGFGQVALAEHRIADDDFACQGQDSQEF